MFLPLEKPLSLCAQVVFIFSSAVTQGLRSQCCSCISIMCNIYASTCIYMSIYWCSLFVVWFLRNSVIQRISIYETNVYINTMYTCNYMSLQSVCSHQMLYFFRVKMVYSQIDRVFICWLKSNFDGQDLSAKNNYMHFA